MVLCCLILAAFNPRVTGVRMERTLLIVKKIDGYHSIFRKMSHCKMLVECL